MKQIFILISILVVVEFEVPAGKKIKEKTIFYSVNSPVCLVGEKITYILNYSNVNAKIEGDNITLFNGKSSFNCGNYSFPPDQNQQNRCIGKSSPCLLSTYFAVLTTDWNDGMLDLEDWGNGELG